MMPHRPISDGQGAIKQQPAPMTTQITARYSSSTTKPPPSHGLGSCLQFCIWKLGEGYAAISAIPQDQVTGKTNGRNPSRARAKSRPSRLLGAGSAKAARETAPGG